MLITHSACEPIMAGNTTFKHCPTKAPPRRYNKGCERIFSTSKSSLLLLSKHATTPSLKYATTSLYNHSATTNFACPYFTSTPMYAPCVVAHHPHIPTLGYLHRQPSRITSSMFPSLLPPEESPHYSRRMNKHIIIRRNQPPNLLKNKRIEASIRR